MNELDAALLSLLIKDSRLSFADISRQLGCSRAHARARVQALLEEGTVEQFTAVVNPEKLGKVTSTFVDLKVKSHVIEAVATELAAQPEVARVCKIKGSLLWCSATFWVHEYIRHQTALFQIHLVPIDFFNVSIAYDLVTKVNKRYTNGRLVQSSNASFWCLSNLAA